MTSTTTSKSDTVDVQTSAPIFKDGPLNTIFSTRIRLTDEERFALKEAYNREYNSSLPTTPPPVGNSMVSVQTSYGSSRELDLALGMGRVAAIDLLQTRDTVPLTLILKIQKVLGLEVIKAERIESAFKHYLAFMFA